ncbi:MAG: hypothetical protein A2857_04285 [Candidatus Levybacteria bacterium RIFCSPHIGHO2_01_FULL_36_15]|nr:MAG: hypothetical protein A2857_04285 [Candidatus Levybacteria bacterium RIFCSPHIGHO2_01_FULL_36_15]OGH37306.1 MAG: hypothetical protein A2905_03560 [Candidatus Levybacteria bacterium RIFCSPLOWO2_01_FULL_36_10]
MKILVVGSSVIDLFIEIEDKNHIEFIKNKIQLTSGDKIPIDIKTLTIGGDGANVSVGLSLLERQTTFYTYFGNDIFSKEIEEAINKKGVKLMAQKNEEGKSSLSLVFNIGNDRIIFSHHEKRNHIFNYQENSLPDFIYLTSVGDYWQEAYKSVLEFAKKNGIPLGLTPGTHQFEAPTDILLEIIKTSKIVLVNREEAAKILSWKNVFEPDIKDLMSEFKKLGPQIISVTDGAQGASCLDETNNYYYIKPFQEKILEKTGAGDAYTSGFLSAYFNNLSINECMKWGSLNSNSVMQKVGAQEGLLTKDEIEKIVRENPDYKAEKI